MSIPDTAVKRACCTRYRGSSMQRRSAHLFSCSWATFSNFRSRNLKKIMISQCDRQKYFSWKFSETLGKHLQSTSSISLDGSAHTYAIFGFLRRVPYFFGIFQTHQVKIDEILDVFWKHSKNSETFLKIHQWYKHGHMHRKRGRNWFPAFIKNIFEFWVSSWRLFFLQK